MKLNVKLAVAAVLAIGLSSAAAYADTITFTLTKPTGYVPVAGGSLTYNATVSAPTSNTTAVFLNGDSFNITGPVTLNDSDFLSVFPPSLAPGATFTGNLFVLTVPPNSPFGTFLGTFTLLGGANSSADNTLGTVNFSLVTTPEPSSVVMLLTAIAALALTLFWGRSRGNIRGWVS